jgi:RNA polymerase sigma factor (sigma-70 family)
MLMADQVEEAIRRCFEFPDDQDVLTEFDRLFRPVVMIALSRIARRSATMIEDAYQSAFIKYIRLFREKQHSAHNYTNYFLAIAKNTLIDALRADHRATNLEGLWEEMFAGGDQQDSALNRVLLLEAMMLVGPRCHYLLDRYYLGGAPVAEIAKVLTVAPASVYVLLQRCRDELRRLLSTNRC